MFVVCRSGRHGAPRPRRERRSTVFSTTLPATLAVVPTTAPPTETAALPTDTGGAAHRGGDADRGAGARDTTAQPERRVERGGAPRRARSRGRLQRSGAWTFASRDDCAACAHQPRPTNGILVAMIGHELHVGVERQAGHVDDRVGDVLHVHARLDGAMRAVGLRHAAASCAAVISVAALPMSIWPQAMS